VIRPESLKSVGTNGGEYAHWAEQLRVTALPDMLAKLEAQGRLDEFEFVQSHEGNPPHTDGPWDDSDIHKWIEAASLALVLCADTELRQDLERVIDVVLGAIDPSGYLDAFTSVSGDPQWGHPSRGNHVLYNQGHFIEAAIAHRVLDPDSRLFAAAIRLADLIDGAYRSREVQLAAHQEIELALCRLTAATGDTRYQRLAELMLDDRGHVEGRVAYGSWSQDHEPIVDQVEIVGHTVRAIYQNIAADEIARHTGRADLASALQRQWEDLLSRKILISGGSGRVMEGPSGIEGFRAPFDLDSHEVDVDTCTAIALALWAAQRAEADDDAVSADVAEHEVFNRVFAGVSLNMTSYFYGMPLESTTAEGFDGWGNAVPFGTASNYRQPWYTVPCCPPNIARLLLQLPLIASRMKDDVITVDQYIAHTRTFDNGTTLEVDTDYPRSGRIAIRLVDAKRGGLRVRIPGWLSGAVLDGTLYRTESVSDTVSILVDGEVVEAKPSSYLEIDNDWEVRPTVVIEFPMAPRLVRADPRASALSGQSAVALGALIYCREGDSAISDETSVDLTDAVVQPHKSLPVNEIVLADGRSLIPLAAVDNRARPAFWVWR